jgi:hypothetical protein
MVARKGKKSAKKVRSLPVKSLSSKQARGVKGGFGASNPANKVKADGTSNT